MENTEEFFYKLRSKKWEELEPVHAAARTLFLNKTCFNGLYRVNKKGQFNVPYGRYKRVALPNLETLLQISQTLSNTKILQGDYLEVLKQNAAPEDFVFLDPPYIPVSQFSDFKRYTKEQFHIDDHYRLAEEVHRLVDLGCYVLLTNSNHPVVHELYERFEIEVIPTRRSINNHGARRRGEDVIVKCVPEHWPERSKSG